MNKFNQHDLNGWKNWWTWNKTGVSICDVGRVYTSQMFTLASVKFHYGKFWNNDNKDVVKTNVQHHELFKTRQQAESYFNKNIDNGRGMYENGK